MPRLLFLWTKKLANVENQLEIAKVEVTKPFEKEQELSEKLERLSTLNALLNMDEKAENIDEEAALVDTNSEEEPEIEQEADQNESISYYVAESAEYHSKGIMKEYDNLEDAIGKYKAIKSSSVLSFPEIGFIYHNNSVSLYDGTELPFVSGNRQCNKVINSIEIFKNCDDIQTAIKKIEESFPYIKEMEKTTEYRKSIGKSR